MTTQISPSLLTTHNIPIFQMKHGPGTFLVTFPKAYHAGFSYGFNVGEAVNFATYDWLSSGGEAEERYRTFARNSVFSHQRLLFTLLHHKADVATQYQAKYVAQHPSLYLSFLLILSHLFSILLFFLPSSPYPLFSLYDD
jgi:JmjC domain, hydroxylase